MKKFQINEDMLGIIAWLSRRLGPNVGHSGTVQWLRDICDQLPEKEHERYIAMIAFDVLPGHYRQLLYAHLDGKITLTAHEEREFRSRGFLYGEKPEFPKSIIDRIRFYLEHDVIHVDDRYLIEFEKVRKINNG